ncbi:MAG: copper homeostasis protein CutC, partial [Aggregatilineales bacterium]
DSKVNHDAVAQIAAAAHPIPLTFHRAIDYSITVNDDLKNMHPSVTRILASGMTQSAWSGRDQLAAWMAASGERFHFACAGGVTLENIAALYRITGVHEYHIGGAVRVNGMVDIERVKMAKQHLNTA